MILGYEQGHAMRNIFYAAMTGDSQQEQDFKAGWEANAKVEVADLVTQARILCEIMGWDWTDVIDTGEAKLTDRIATYKQRGVRPNDTLMRALMSMSSPVRAQRPPVRKREGD
jgi:hypothetical protein